MAGGAKMKSFFLLLGFLTVCCHATMLWAGTLAIEYSMDGKKWKKDPAVSLVAGQPLHLRVTPNTFEQVVWKQIYPDLSKMYKNANFPWDPDAYKWTGFGKIDYLVRDFDAFKGQPEIEIKPEYLRLPVEMPYYHYDMGTFWVQVVAVKGGKTFSTAGVEAGTERGISPQVFRVSFRKDDSFIGYLSSFFNVPAVFGSTPYQSYHYIGVDCADALLSAHAHWIGYEMKKDVNVAAMVKAIKPVTSFEIEKGTPDKQVKWGSDIFPCDLIAVRYAGANMFQHIGALYEDANGNGILDDSDTVMHVGPYPLTIEKLKKGPFDGHVVIMRPPSGKIFR